MPFPSVECPSATVGLGLVLQQTPRAVMVVPPLAVIRPPLLAVVALTSVTAVVVIVASSPLSSFLQPKTVNSSTSVAPVSQILEELKVLWFMGSMGYQLSVISYQLSVVGYRLSVIGFLLSVVCCLLSVLCCQFSVVSSLLFICSLLPHDATEPFFGELGAANHAVAVV
jgi:hypothetical protein